MQNFKNAHLVKTTPLDTDSESKLSNNKSSLNKKRKFTKESKFKEATRLCLYQTKFPNDPNQIGEIQKSNLDCKRNLVKFLAKDFLTDCRQRLDIDSFKKLLILLKIYLDEAECKSNLSALEEIYQLIKQDLNLCNKFSAFLTNETSLYFGLFTQFTQYEKCYNFLQKLEILTPNKCSFRKLLQSITTSCNSSYESETVSNKIEEIKLKIKSVTKNNALIDFELDYLFDQRWANLEPSYEKISLLNSPDNSIENQNEPNSNETTKSKPETIPQEDQSKICDMKQFSEEFIDLTNGLSTALIQKSTSKKDTKKKPITKPKYEYKKKQFLVTLKKHS